LASILEDYGIKMDLEQLGQELIAEFGDRLPNPEQEPIRFKYYLNLFFYERYLNEQRARQNQTQQTPP